MRHAVTLLFPLAVAVPVAAQQTVTLNRPEAEFAEPFSRITSVRELASRKVYVSDALDKTVQLVDFVTGATTRVGREGNGPGEYARPGALVALPDGGTLVQDLSNQRFLLLSAEGKAGGFVTPRPPAAPSAVSGGGFSLGGNVSLVRAADRQGRIYWEGPPFTSDGQPADSAPILRWDRVKPAFDTIAWLPLPKNAGSITRGGSGSNQTVMVRIGSDAPWPTAHRWTVAGDGRVAMVSPDPYRVTWISGATRTAGPVVPYTPIRVTEAEKKEERDRRARTRPVTVGFGGGSGAPPSQAARQQSEPEWPETMPPFTGTSSVLATPDGQVWVLRTRKASDKVPTYDVFDTAGKLAGKVTLRPNSRVVGFGQGTVYVARADEDDLEYLERYRR